MSDINTKTSRAAVDRYRDSQV